MNTFFSKKVVIDDEIISLRHYKAKPNNSSLVILLHGAGNSNQGVLSAISIYLQNVGIDCVSFDFSGHGESTANTNSSLSKKTQEAIFVYSMFSKYENIHLFAFSMSGQIAINLIEKFKTIKSITLFSPALYTKDAFNIPFGEQFKKTISEKDSWKNTNAYDILNKYAGKITLIISKKDLIIPKGVFDIYRNSSITNNYSEIIFEDAPHTLGKWISEDPKRFNPIFNKIKSYLLN